MVQSLEVQISGTPTLLLFDLHSQWPRREQPCGNLEEKQKRSSQQKIGKTFQSNTSVRCCSVIWDNGESGRTVRFQLGNNRLSGDNSGLLSGFSNAACSLLTVTLPFESVWIFKTILKQWYCWKWSNIQYVGREYWDCTDNEQNKILCPHLHFFLVIRDEE